MICQFFRGGGLALILVVKGVWQTVAKYTVKVESQGDRNIFQGSDVLQGDPTSPTNPTLCLIYKWTR